MNTKFLSFCILFALMPFFSGNAQQLPDPPPASWEGTLYDYTGYSRIYRFDNGALTNSGSGTANITTAVEDATNWANANIITAAPGFLDFNADGGVSGNRASRVTIGGTAINFTNKLLLEFDFASNNISGTQTDCEGQIIFRSGTGFTNNVLFTLFNVRGMDNQLGIAIGPLNTTEFAQGRAKPINEPYSAFIPYTPGKWYHIKVEIYRTPQQRFSFTITDGEAYYQQLMFPMTPSYNIWQLSQLCFRIHRSGNNVYWRTGIDNLAFTAVTETQPATSVTVTSGDDEIGLNGSTWLEANVAPWDVTDYSVIWSVDRPDLATVTPGSQPWSRATLTGTGVDFGTVTVTATSSTEGVLGTKEIEIKDIKLSRIEISGLNSVSVNNTIQLTATVTPLSATNINVVWSSENLDIATVDPATGVVTGISSGIATIRATAADEGGATNTYDVIVEFKPVTSIELQGARRLFYSNNLTNIAPFSLNPVFTPIDASIQTLVWSSTNESVATVNDQGQVTLAGGTGKAGIKAMATDESGIEGYYYIETGPANTWDTFGDFETNTTPFTSDIGRSLFQGTQVVQRFQQNEGAPRNSTWQLSSNSVTGREINMRFDWYPGTIPGANNLNVLSIQDRTTNPTISIISLVTDNTLEPFRYLIGNYSEVTTFPPEEGSEDPMPAELRPQGNPFEIINKFDRWYTVEISFNFQNHTCTLTITDRDEPEITETIEDIPLSPVDSPDPRIAQLYVWMSRSGQNNDTRVAIDNFGYKIVNSAPPSYEVTSLKLEGLDNVTPGGQIMVYPRFIPDRATNRAVRVESSDPSIATIEVNSQGLIVVTGISTGEVTITVTSVENAEAFAQKTIAVAPSSLPQRQMERLTRGLVAVKVNNGVFLSWRLFATDPEDVTFNLYKNDSQEPVNAAPRGPAHTDFTDPAGTEYDTYSVAVLVDGQEIYRSEAVTVMPNQYLSIPVEKPVTGRLNTTGAAYGANNYTIYDGVVADLDGDGQYEIIFIWGPNNMRDNAHEGETGTMFIDAYKLNGTKLWGAGKFIDLGRNIRAGAHYPQLLVFDFDGDGKAEIIVRAADGTLDTEGTVIGDANAFYANASGRVLAGPEFIAVFEGATGKLLDHKPYQPARGNVSDWGDTHGNRVDRFLAAVAYLDGVRPSAVMCRGYYARTVLAAWDWNGKELSQRWIFDSWEWGKQYEGQGNHQLSVADVDGDGKDDIIYGAMTIGSDGKPMYTTGYNHGDAMHVGKFIPDRPGLQVMSVHESPRPYGMEMHDAMTGDLIWGVVASGDIGRGVCADVDPLYPGAESWGAGGMAVRSSAGQQLSGSAISSMNMAIWWDGDTGRELFDGSSNPTVRKISATGTAPNRNYTQNTIFTFTGGNTNGGTKQNPCLQADIFGDWREEVILRGPNDDELRIYTTTTPTVHADAGAVPASGIPTLMHDHTYRLAIAWQNTGYNQPPHTGFFIGYNMENVPRNEGMAFTVTLNPNGGMFDDNTIDEKQIFTMTGAYFAIPQVTNAQAKAFDGWYLPDGKKYDPVATYKEDLVLKAVWTLETYTLTVNNGSGDGAYLAGAAVTIIANEAPEGHQFAEWLITPSMTFVAGNANTPVAEFTMPDQAVIATAVYVPIPHGNHLIEVTSDGNGIGNADVVSAPQGTLITLTADEHVGYHFVEWLVISENITLSNATDNSATFDMPDEAVVVMATFAPDVYTVTFNANAENVTVTPTTKSVTYNVAVGALPAPTRTGYTFAGWNSVANGSGLTYTVSTVYTVADDQTLYAQWRANIYKLNFIANAEGVTVTPQNQEVSYNEAVGDLPTPIRTGYTLAGWNTEANGSGTPYTASTEYILTNDLTLYAQWTANTYTLTFDANADGVTVTPETKNVSYDAAIGDLPVPVRTGYTLAGWNTETNGSGTSYTALTTYVLTSDLMLYAQWTANTYTLTFNANADEVTVTPATKNVTYDMAVGALPAPARTGYTLAGWNSETNGSGTSYDVSTLYKMADNLTLYAQWTANTYTLTFNANADDVTVTPESKEVLYNAAVGDLPTPTRTGYTLAGWNSETNGSGTSYNVLTTYTVANNQTLYAQWMAITFILTFNANADGATVNPETKNVSYDAAVGDLPVPVRTGYSLSGWNTEANGSGTTYIASTLYTVANDQTLYAQWTTNTYTLRFIANAKDITVTPETKNVTYGAAVGELPTPIQTGYNFNGWNTAVDGNGTIYTASTVYLLTDHLMLYAQWKLPTGISELEINNLKVYPNPAKDMVYISGLEGGEIITFMDVSGRKWMQVKAINPKEDIAVSHFPKGAYLVVITRYQTEKTVKIVIE